MDETAERPQGQHSEGVVTRKRSAGRWHWRWQAILAALLALVAVEGQPVAASHPTNGPAARAVGTLRQAAPSIPAPASGAAGEERTAASSAISASDGRPDFRATIADLDGGQAGQPFSYTIQVWNAGSAGGGLSVSTVVPPAFSNVRVTAPGFVCTRYFTPSGPEAGTEVACMRNDLDGGTAAELTIEANAPSVAGAYQLTATVHARDDLAEADEANNAADATVQVTG
jgi:hypothetical protein